MQLKRLKVGVVGAGLSHSPDGRERWAVRTHIPALKKLAETFDLVAVCTTRMETATEAAKHFGVPQAFDSVERMLAEIPDLDIVCVSVRPVYHYAVVMAALNAGKHVYCEQPLGVNTAQAQEMCELADLKGVRTVIGHQAHYEPATLHMAELVRDGYIGTPLTFSHGYFVSNYIAPRPSHREWLFQASAGGHPGYRSGHSLERLMYVLGRDVTQVSADLSILVPERIATDTGGVLKSNQVENMNYLLKLGDTLIGTLQVSFTAWFGTGNRFELYGSEGMLMLTTDPTPQNWTKEGGEGDPTRGQLRLFGARVDMKKMLDEQLPPERFQRDFQEIEIPSRHTFVDGFRSGQSAFLVAQTWMAFANAIREGHECHPSFRDKLKIHYVWDAAEESSRTRSWQDVSYTMLPR